MREENRGAGFGAALLRQAFSLPRRLPTAFTGVLGARNLRSPNKSEPKFDPSGLPSGTITNLVEASNRNRRISYDLCQTGADDTTTPKVTTIRITPATESRVGSKILWPSRFRLMIQSVTAQER